VLTTATVNATAANNAFASTTVPITDPGGTHKLYFVFQTVPGGPASGFGNLNWVEFAGQGVGGYAVAPANGGGRPAGAPHHRTDRVNPARSLDPRERCTNS
jgi:hypothetical protein